MCAFLPYRLPTGKAHSGSIWRVRQAVGEWPQFALTGRLELCRFLDAGHHERRLLLRRPASKKRRGTKSRGVWPPVRAAGAMGI